MGFYVQSSLLLEVLKMNRKFKPKMFYRNQTKHQINVFFSLGNFVWNLIPMPINVTDHKYNEEGKQELKAWK